MPDKQLNVWLPEELRNHVAKRAEQEKRGMNAIIAELIQHDIAQRHSEMVESNSLAVVREMMAEEIRQAHAQLRRSLRDDREAEAELHHEWVQKQIDRLAGLSVMAIRNAGIARRLVYTVLSKSYGPGLAKVAHDDAREKVQLELLPKKTVKHHVQSEDE